MLKALIPAAAAAFYVFTLAAPTAVVSSLVLGAASTTAEAKVVCHIRHPTKIKRCYGTPDPLPPKPDPKGIKLK
ncbi:MAG: hypothetical protein ABL898_03845 [Hyphomicrobiaceae bacterium]|nr:hypothetical protein [Hyphomicrobiaceae bacterium]